MSNYVFQFNGGLGFSGFLLNCDVREVGNFSVFCKLFKNLNFITAYVSFEFLYSGF